ncbi:unnamed protein product, partial [Effrenium voratum]
MAWRHPLSAFFCLPPLLVLPNSGRLVRMQTRAVTLQHAAQLRGVPRPLSFLLPRGSALSKRGRTYIFDDEPKPLSAADAWLDAPLGSPSPLLALWKPVGVVTTMAEEPKSLRRLLDEMSPLPLQQPQPVGRLDKGTSGLLFLAENGDLHRILLASGYIRKTYVATVNKASASEEQLAQLLAGVDLGDGAAPARAVAAKRLDPEVVPRKGGLTGSVEKVRVEVQVSEGRFRLVRRLFDACGLPLRALHREAVGSLSCRLLGAFAPRRVVSVEPPEVLDLLAAGRGPEVGQAVYNALRCGSLLCNLRRGSVPEPNRERLERWLAEHWTLEGPCLGPFRQFTGTSARCACEDAGTSWCLPRKRGSARVQGIQVAKVDASGQVLISEAFGCVGYCSWQAIHPSDPFPLGATVLSQPLLAAATARALQKRGISLSASAERLLWPNAGPFTVGDVVRGKLQSKAPPAASSRLLGDLKKLMEWLEHL